MIVVGARFPARRGASACEEVCVVSQPVMNPPEVEQPPRLLRSREDRVIGGVAGGLAHYLSVDPVVIRLVFVILAVFGGGGILAYIVAWIVIPEAPADGPAPAPRAGTNTPVFVGLVLVALGGLLLADQLVPLFSWRYVGPAALIALGGLLVARKVTDR
jgi:phage shock protein C